MRTDQSNIGVYLWLVFLFVVNAMWIGMDLWLRANGHELLTKEFQEGLHGWWGPFLSGAVAFTIAAFVTHMWNLR